MAKKGSMDQLLNTGLLQPSGKDWRISVFFADGTRRVVRVSPGKCDEAAAVAKAFKHCKIFDDSVVDRVEAERVDKTTQVVSTGIIHNTGKKETNEATGADD